MNHRELTGPAGDAGLERQPADAEYQTICGWVTKYGWLNAAMAERVRQLLHRQQAVVEAARAAVSEYFDILEAQQREVLGDDAQEIIEEMEQSTTGTRRLAEARRTVYALLGRTAQAARSEGGQAH